MERPRGSHEPRRDRSRCSRDAESRRGRAARRGRRALFGIVRLVAVHASLSLSACGLLPVGGAPTGSPGGAPSGHGDGLREFRAVFHCHGHLSHDSDGTPEEIAAAARRIGIDVVLFTDHYAPGNFARAERGLRSCVLFIPGVELRHPGGGSLLAVGPKRDFEENQPFASRVEQMRQDGAFLVAGHVEKLPPDADLGAYGGFEIYNLHAQFSGTSGWATAARLLAFPPDSFFERSIDNPEPQLERWDAELRRARLAPLGGHDAHANVRLFGPLGGVIGTYQEVFRLFSTRILAAELTEESILAALHRGHVHVVFDYLGDAAGFSTRCVAPGRAPALPGDEVAWVPSTRVVATAPLECELRLIRDGAIVARRTGRDADWPIGEPGVHRVEARLDGRVWIVAAAFRITGAAPATGGSDASPSRG